jgi:hypothetical protein
MPEKDGLTPPPKVKIQSEEIEPDYNKNMVQFLETWAPLRKFREPLWDSRGNRARPSIHMRCDVCNSAQTFIVCNDPNSNMSWFFERIEEPFEAELWRYLCMGCRRFGRLFFLAIGTDVKGRYVRKLGQKPEWEASLDPELKRLLGESAVMFRRGLDCEGTGYGIGAYAYYRRVVEDMIGDLLDRIPALLTEGERPIYAAALEEVHKTTITQTKIELVKDLLPSRLQPEGINPLGVLHSELSGGLHGRSDEDCLDDAEAVRSALAYLVTELSRAEQAGKQFTEGMRKLLERRSSSVGQRALLNDRDDQEQV